VDVYWLSMISMGVVGVVFALGLAFASNAFAVDTDPRAEAIEEVLPGANCGACGFSGCSGFAQGVTTGEAEAGGCPVGGADVAKAIADIMGIAAPTDIKRKVAQLLCSGDCQQANNRAEYNGVADCRAALLAGGGGKMCTYGCLGLGTCAAACPFDAITMNEYELPVVDERLCTGCGHCVEACPRDLFQLVEEQQGVHIRCRSLARGKEVRQACSVGCIGCRRCARECPEEAIEIVDNLAVIDYKKCTNCGTCVEVCPTNTIHWQKEKPEVKKLVAVS
jgi:electron transport complex protein RnfB